MEINGSFTVFCLVCFAYLNFNTISCLSATLPSSLRLPKEEVAALREIGRKLGKNDWNFSTDPCSGEGNWSLPITRNGFGSSVTCDCSDERNPPCYVISIALKAQNLTGGVPSEFSLLQHLISLDLSRNYLNGSIPQEWASMRLEYLSFMGNRLSGPFPLVITRISTLVNLSLEGNRFSGFIPSDIGHLTNLQKLVLSSNAFTGELPMNLSKLIQLTDLRISDNNFTGRIPDFISSWTRMEKLRIQGCSFMGPIPLSISALRSLVDLRISDLTSGESTFPPLNNAKSLRLLILRGCLIHGELPEYLADMETLLNLDLSFNNLTGQIPPSFVRLSKIDFLFLTGNHLTGEIPEWILRSNSNADISYNNFTSEGSTKLQCMQGNVNLAESFSSTSKKLGRIEPCLKRGYPCSDPANLKYSLYINCGGIEVRINNTIYKADNFERRGASSFYTGQNWAVSSTGNFMDDDADADSYIDTNVSALYNVAAPSIELYKSARVSPLSLTYYGLCLGKGNYTVKLHFAEIIFTNDSSFNSLGRRVFDVYLQGKLVLKDFDIAAKAGGPGKPIIETFNATVTGNTLKIRLYWAGKGTTGIPERGIYGPLISAISVYSNFKPPVHKKFKYALLAGITGGVFLLLFLILGLLHKIGCFGGNTTEDTELRGLDQLTGRFTLRQIQAATNNFDPVNKIGEGGFGSVYKGHLSDGTLIAVKQLSPKSKQGTREFVNEIGTISALQHPNLVKLSGFCAEGNHLMLIYEYMENNSLYHALFGKDATQKLVLDWSRRKAICLDIARGLAYLHEESMVRIVHRDIKTSNVLLDRDMNAKISDFGLARLNEDDKTHISTRVAGTVGYIAPEYAMRGCLTDKADVYSFGVVSLETITGKSNTNYIPDEDFVYLLDRAYVLQERGNLLELVDPELGSAYSSEEAMLILNVALLCTNAAPSLRPKMSQVVSILEGETAVQDLFSGPGFSRNDSKFMAKRNHFWQNESSTQSLSPQDKYTDSSLSG